MGILFTMCFAMVLITPSPVAATDPPGVGNTPVDVTTLSSWDYGIHKIYEDYTYFRMYSYYGIFTETSFQHEVFLGGPTFTSLKSTHPYVKSQSLTVQRILCYVPMFSLESENWYSHTLEIDSSFQETLEFELSAGIDIDDGTCKIWGGGSIATTTTSGFGWSVTAENGQTRIIYVRSIFLRVFGSVTYDLGSKGTETHTYDVTILQECDLNNIVVRDLSSTYNKLPVGEKTYYDSANDGDSQPDLYYGMGNKWVSYEEASSVSLFVGLEFKIGDEDFAFFGEAKFTWTNSQFISIKHIFDEKIEDAFSYYYIYQNNFFNVNIEPFYTGSGGGSGTGPVLTPW